MSAYGIDFSHYKPSTVARRIERRLLLRRAPSLADYLAEIHRSPGELHALYRDLLICVTRFFRDPEAFDVLAERVLPVLLSHQAPGEELRIWVAGCATGEEVYSLAIVLHECATAMQLPPNFKIFATDAHRDSLEFAATGVYPQSSVSGISPSRLDRYFTHHGGSCKIRPEIRGGIVFAPQDLLKDPPFTKIDLIVCRNLLIYFKPAAQRKVLDLFHGTLNSSGCLFLGPSEGVGELSDEFDIIDQHWKMFQKRRDVRPLASTQLAIPSGLGLTPAAPAARSAAPPGDPRLLRAYETLLDRLVPSSILITAQGEIARTFGDAARYLHPPAGRASLHIAELILDDLRASVVGAIQSATREGTASIFPGVRVRTGDGEEFVTITAAPIPEHSSEPPYLFLGIETLRPAEPSLPVSLDGPPDHQIHGRLAGLERELRFAREHLNATIEEREATNEELQATNEELVASNEELHSTNEELHSVNQELYTINTEYQSKIDELMQLTNDMDNLLHSTDIGVVFLDTELRIRKVTPAISASFYLLPRDVGRPIEQISSNLEYPALMADLREVLTSHRPIEREVRNRADAWLLMRVLPYRTDAGVTEGIVLTFTDITAMRRAQQELRHSEFNFRELADFVNAIFWLTSPDGTNIIYVSPGYEKLWKRSLDTLCHTPSSWLDALHPDDRQDLVHSFATRNLEKEWEAHYRIVWPDGSVRWIRDRRYPVRDSQGKVIRLAGISVDVTEVKASQQRLELTQFAVDNAGDMVFWARPDGGLLYANDSAARALGYSRDTLLTMSLAQLDLRRPPGAWPDFVARLQVEGFLTFESIFLTSDGRQIPVEISSTCLRFDDTFYCCSVARDIAQRKHAERELSRYAGELERANESLRHHNRELDEFAYLASHDLKEPLRAITTFSQLLTQDIGSDLPEDAVRDLEFITSAAARMQRLIVDLLALSRAGRADMKTTSVSLHQCATSALGAIAARLRETGAEIRIAEDLPTVTGDATMLTQLFQNLLSNALKFRSDRKPIIEITGTAVDGIWTFGVHDNGIGIKSEYCEKIFQPFRRIHVQSSQEGTGIGLAICRKVVERHGGRIWVESAPNAGAHFYFTLGATAPEATLAR